jgi:hypothetical protein
MTHNVFNVGDNVQYTGTTLTKKYADSMKKGKIGEIVARVLGEENCYVVAFGESTSFIVHVDSLMKHTFKDKEDNTVIERIARKWGESD